VGDANNKFFHLKTNARQRRNHIPSLQHEGATYITHEAKFAALFNFYSKQFGCTSTREQTLNWDLLMPARHDLQDLHTDPSEEEIKAAVMATAPEKAPGSDGFIGAFFKSCWKIVKQELVAAIQGIFALRAGC
jgi:hypothetical protein